MSFLRYMWQNIVNDPRTVVAIKLMTKVVILLFTQDLARSCLIGNALRLFDELFDELFYSVWARRLKP